MSVAPIPPHIVAIKRWLGLARIEIQTASGSNSANTTLEGMEDPTGTRDFLYLRMRGAREEKAGDAADPAPRYIPIDRKQLRLEHSARKIWRVVEQLDLSRFETQVRAVEGVAGRPWHSPQVLVAV